MTTPANAAASGSRAEIPEFQAAIRAEFEVAVRAIKEKDEAVAALIGDQSRLSANTWLRRTGWPRHLRGFDREWLATTIRRPVVEKEEVEEGNEEDGEDRENGEEVRGQGRDRDRDDSARSEPALAVVLLAVARVI